MDLTQLKGKIDKKWGIVDEHGEGRSATDAIVKNAKLTNRLPKKRVVNSKETRSVSFTLYMNIADS